MLWEASFVYYQFSLKIIGYKANDFVCNYLSHRYITKLFLIFLLCKDHPLPTLCSSSCHIYSISQCANTSVLLAINCSLFHYDFNYLFRQSKTSEFIWSKVFYRYFAFVCVCSVFQFMQFMSSHDHAISPLSCVPRRPSPNQLVPLFNNITSSLW